MHPECANETNKQVLSKKESANKKIATGVDLQCHDNISNNRSVELIKRAKISYASRDLAVEACIAHITH